MDFQLSLWIFDAVKAYIITIRVLRNILTDSLPVNYHLVYIKYNIIVNVFITIGHWSVPCFTGKLPPCAGFSITKLPGNKALLIGRHQEKIMIFMMNASCQADLLVS